MLFNDVEICFNREPTHILSLKRSWNDTGRINGIFISFIYNKYLFKATNFLFRLHQLIIN